MSRLAEGDTSYKPLIKLIRENSLTLTYVPSEKLDRITRKNHQGVVAYLSPVQFADIEDVIDNAFVSGRIPFILALDRITDVRNFGAMVRSAECAGADAILVPTKGSAQIGSDAVKTSAGALHHLPVCKTTNLAAMLRKLKSAGLRIVACSDHSSLQLHEGDFSDEPIVLVIGSEEDGISDDVLRMADTSIKIPMYGQIASLNASVACGIALYEIVRRRNSL